MSQNSFPPLAAPAVDETSQVVSDQVHIKMIAHLMIFVMYTLHFVVMSGKYKYKLLLFFIYFLFKYVLRCIYLFYVMSEQLHSLG